MTREEVAAIAWLARLRIDDDEMAGYVQNLSRIIDFVEQLGAADTGGVTPMAHPLDMSQRLRADEVTEADMRERFQRDAAAVEAGLYLVPKVID